MGSWGAADGAEGRGLRGDGQLDEAGRILFPRNSKGVYASNKNILREATLSLIRPRVLVVEKTGSPLRTETIMIVSGEKNTAIFWEIRNSKKIISIVVNDV